MGFKKIMLVLIFMLAILTIGSVSAADDNATSLAVDEDLILESSNDEALSTGEGTFSDLSTLINNTPENGVLELDNDYINDGSESEITISKSLTIDGKGHTLDADGKSRIFNITVDDVTLKNIVFGNGYCNNEGCAIYLGTSDYYSSINIINCSFENCYSNASDYGGAIYIENEGNIVNCSFVNCSSHSGGGAIDFRGPASKTSMISNSTFINCSSVRGGGAISGGNSNIDNCVFIDCYNECYGGGAIRFLDGGVVNCSFVNCSSRECGGAIMFDGEMGRYLIIIDNSSFVNCSAGESGGAICIGWTGSQINIGNCSFVNCSAQSGAAISVDSETTARIISSSFENNGMKQSDVVSGGIVSNCSFVDSQIPSTNQTKLNTTNETRTMLLVNSANVYLGDNVTVTAIVYNQNSEMLSGTVDVYVNSTFIGSKNINEAFTFAPDKLGKYIIEARFNETSDYNASSASVTVNVIENVVPEEMTSDDEGIVILEFPDDAGGEVEVFIDGVSVEVVKIVNGIAVIDLSKYKGNYTVSFVYSGDDNYPAFVKESNVTVNVNTAIITAKDTKVLYTAGQKFSVTVYEDENVAAKSTPVEFKVNGKYFKTYNTNDNGIASFKVTQTPGTYKVQVTALGKTVTKTLTVKHLVTLKKVTVKRSAKKLVLTATLAKVNKKYLKNKKVTFKFNGKKYTAKTNKKGVAKVTIKSTVLKKLKAGKKITYQATYLKDTVKQNAKVKK